ncbi:MAG TPA: tetratricopeptide repeat protein [Blastocatellia bacterium]|nr:tetratricopeptide repeat protein [Blastocatellia bacterium]
MPHLNQFAAAETSPSPARTSAPPIHAVATAARSAWAERLSARRFHIAFLCLLVILTFTNSLYGGFVYDDHRVVLKNPLLGHWDWATLRIILTHDYWAAYNPDLLGGNIDSLFYRPLYHLSHMLSYAVAGKNPFLWHLISVVAHAGAAVMAYLTIDRTLAMTSRLEAAARRCVSVLAAAIFAVHPVQSETVAWVSAVGNSLMAIGFFGAFLCYLHYRSSRRWLWLLASLGLFMLAALMKETTITLPLLVGAFELFVANHETPVAARLKRAVIAVLPFVFATAIYFVIRYSVLHVIFGEFTNGNFPDDALLTMGDRARTLPLLLAHYSGLVLAPFNLSMMYDVGMVRAATFSSFWLPLAVVALLCAVGVVTARRIPEVRLALIWMIIPLLPQLSLGSFVSEELLHDRFLYLSMLGFGLFVALLAHRLLHLPRVQLSRAAVFTVAGALLALLCMTTVAQNRQWASDEALWVASAEHSPNSRVVHMALGEIAEDKGDLDAALREYEAALQVHPDIIDALNNSAFVLAKLGRWPEASARFERLAQLTPDKAIAHFNLSFAYGRMRRYPEALRELERAIEIAPRDPRADQWRAQAEQLRRALGAPMTPTN